MTIIFQLGSNFWIEDLNVLASSVLANSQSSTAIVLERPGDCIGITTAIMCNESDEALASLIYTIIRNQSTGGTIPYGGSLSEVGIRRGNGSGTAVSFGVHVVVFMRKSRG